MADLIEQLRKSTEQKQQAAAEKYRRLVSDTARGVERDVQAAEKILRDAGKTPDDLTGDVSDLKRRIGWHEQWAAVPAAEREMQEITAQAEAADAKLQQAQEEHDAVVAPLLLRADALRQIIRDGEGAKQKLTTDCRYPDVLDAALQLYWQKAQLNERRKALLAEAARQRTSAATANQAAGQFWPPNAAAKAHEDAANAALAKAAELEKLADEVDAEIKSLAPREAELQAEMLKP